MMRIIVTGGRDRVDVDTIWDELDAIVEQHRHLTVVHGDCRTGADRHASNWCIVAQRYRPTLLVIEERHPADWARHGRRAGHIRNAEMIQAGANLVLAFPGTGPGTHHTIDLANRAGIRVAIIPFGGV